MSFLQRLRAFGRMVLIVFVLASAAFLSAVTAMRFAIEGRQVKMPDLVGVKLPDAKHLLQPKGLGVRIEDRVYSKYPLDAIVRQSPPAGLLVKVGERAHVVLSLGPQKILIPDLRNASLRAARIQLLRDGLQLGETSSLYLPGYPSDTVVTQDPPPGTLDATTPHVDFLLSLGDKPGAWVMPSVLCLSESEASEKLASDGLRDLKILPPAASGASPLGSTAPCVVQAPSPQLSPAASAPAPPPAGSNAGATQTSAPPLTPPAAPLGPPSGTVIAQNPPPGGRVEADTVIELRVAQ